MKHFNSTKKDFRSCFDVIQKFKHIKQFYLSCFSSIKIMSLPSFSKKRREYSDPNFLPPFVFPLTSKCMYENMTPSKMKEDCVASICKYWGLLLCFCTQHSNPGFCLEPNTDFWQTGKYLNPHWWALLKVTIMRMGRRKLNSRYYRIYLMQSCYLSCHN